MRLRAVLSVGMAALAASACTPYDAYGPGYGPPPYDDGGMYGDYRYDGRDFDPRYMEDGPPMPDRFGGPGAEILDPWLAETPEGWAIVTTGFRQGRTGWLSEDLAHRINIWFRRYADHDRDMRLTDPEVRTALVSASRERRFDGY